MRRRDEDGGGGATDTSPASATTASAATTDDILRGRGCVLRGGRGGRVHGGEAADADLLRPRDGDPEAAEMVRREQPPVEAAGTFVPVPGCSSIMEQQSWISELALRELCHCLNEIKLRPTVERVETRSLNKRK